MYFPSGALGLSFMFQVLVCEPRVEFFPYPEMVTADVGCTGCTKLFAKNVAF